MFKKLKSISLAILMASVVLAGLSSCNSDNGGNNGGTDYQYLVVTISAMTDAGTTFTYQVGGVDSQLITLTATQSLNKDKFKVGERVMIAFVYSNKNQTVTNPNSGEISLWGVSQVINDKVKFGTSNEYNSFFSETIESAYCWMSGPYLNIQASLVLRNEPKEYCLVMDQSTANSDYPTFYLLFKTDDNINGTLKTAVASYDLSEFWANEANYKGFTLNVSNLYGQRQWTFSRTGTETIKPIE